jgi:hypothetical protein
MHGISELQQQGNVQDLSIQDKSPYGSSGLGDPSDSSGAMWTDGIDSPCSHGGKRMRNSSMSGLRAGAKCAPEVAQLDHMIKGIRSKGMDWVPRAERGAVPCSVGPHLASSWREALDRFARRLPSAQTAHPASRPGSGRRPGSAGPSVSARLTKATLSTSSKSRPSPRYPPHASPAEERQRRSARETRETRGRSSDTSGPRQRKGGGGSGEGQEQAGGGGCGAREGDDADGYDGAEQLALWRRSWLERMDSDAQLRAMRGRLGLSAPAWEPAREVGPGGLAGGDVRELVAEQLRAIRSGQRQRIKALITPLAPHTPAGPQLSSGRRSRAGSERRAAAGDDSWAGSRLGAAGPRPDHSSQNAAVRHIERTRGAQRARSATPHSYGRARAAGERGGRARSSGPGDRGGRAGAESEGTEDGGAGGRRGSRGRSSDGGRADGGSSDGGRTDGHRADGKARDAVTQTSGASDYSTALRLAGTAAAARRGVSTRWTDAVEARLPGACVHRPACNRRGRVVESRGARDSRKTEVSRARDSPLSESPLRASPLRASPRRARVASGCAAAPMCRLTALAAPTRSAWPREARILCI